MAQRFKSLRSYGLLPRGRDHRGQRLSPQEIANAVLGLTAYGPHWAGHVALILAKLQPVGGEQNSFCGARTLQDALAALLTSSPPSPAISRLELSCSEYWTNAVGLAELACKSAGGRRTIYFVPNTTRFARDLGGQEAFSLEEQRPLLDRRTVLTGRFFDVLRREIAAATHATPPDPDEGWEYDEEDIESARLAKLEVRRGAHFLNVGVDNQVTWPKDATTVKFDRYQIVMLPKTKDHVQSVHVDLTANRLSLERGEIRACQILECTELVFR